MNRILSGFSGLNRPQVLAKLHLGFTWFWVIMVPISFCMGWLESVTYVSALSLWALVSGHWSAWQASRVEVVQDEDADVEDVLREQKETQRLLRKLIDATQGDCEDDDAS